MNKINSDVVEKFTEKLAKMNSEEYMKLVENFIEDDAIEAIAAFLEDFYGVSDEDQLGHLTQVFVSGILLDK